MFSKQSLYNIAYCAAFAILVLDLNFKPALAIPKTGDALHFNLKEPPGKFTALEDVDFARGKYVLFSEHSSTIDESAMQNNALLEGDIKGVGGVTVNPENIQEFMNQATSNSVKRTGVHRNAVKGKFQIWPTTRIPYQLSTQYSSYSRSRIAAAMDEYGKRTCIQFVPKTVERDFLSIAPIDGCYSLVGRSGGEQELSLDSGCIAKGIIMHELMHSVGFFHEQSRTDRDQYVDIVWTNIATGLKDQFQKYSSRTLTTQNMPYDYESIMHYSQNAFSKNGQPTIKPKAFGAKIGQRRGFSAIDKQEINTLYQCDSPSGLVTFLPINRPINEAVTARPNLVSGRTVCRDSRPDCGFLRNYNDYCKTQESWMRVHCTKACDYCNSARPGSGSPPRISNRPVNAVVNTVSTGNTRPANKKCNDRFNFCKDWADAGYCNGNLYNKFMRNYCKMSCNTC